MLEELRWDFLPADAALALVQRIVGRPVALKPDVHLSARATALPFWARTRLAHVGLTSEETGPIDFYALVGDEAVAVLDGSSAPVHDANEAEALALDEAGADAYLRFFLFAVRADGEAFRLVEPPEGREPGAAEADGETHGRRLAAKGAGEDGRFRFDAVIAYKDSLFECVFAVGTDGLVEMLDDTMLAAEPARDALPAVPELSAATGLAALLAAPPVAAPAPAPAAALPPGTSVLRVIVETLLEHALRAQASHRLLRHFNVSTGAGAAIGEFARFVRTAAPVVAIESNIRFVEEEVANIVAAQTTGGQAPDVTRGRAADGDDTRLSVPVPRREGSLVLIPCHSYRSIVDIERVAYELSSPDVAVLAGCDVFTDLPEPLRRVVDVTLTLPAIDAALFEEIFVRVLGAAPPAGWRAAGALWVAHVLHTDFQQPRHLGLPADQAFAFVRDRVIERLRSVDPVAGPGLADLHGLAEARQFADDLIADIHGAIAGRVPWTSVDRGVLLVGPPGTGKTTLARAIAKECGVKFISASAATWQATAHLGDHIRAIRADFAQARRYAPAILFIDEIDSVGNREKFSGAGAQYATEVVNAVLEQIQGLDPAAPVIVIAATNNDDRVDAALKRAGRLDRTIEISYPNVEALAAIYAHYLDAHAVDGNLAHDVDTKGLAALSLGLTGADVELMVRGAARRARKAGRPVGQADLIAEITGKPRDLSTTLRLTPEDVERLSIHEAGHALARCLSASRGADITFVSIVPGANGRLGFVATMPPSGAMQTRRESMERIEVALAGRAAEELQFGKRDVSGGAGGPQSSDLAMATRMAVRFVTQYGLGKEGELLWTEAPTPDQIDQATVLLRDAYEAVLDKLRTNQARLLALAAALRQRQEITGDEVRSLMGV